MSRSKKRSHFQQYLPFLQWVHRVDGHSLRNDLLAGLTGAFIVLPQGVAYALIAGMPPEYGLYTAIVTSIIASLFGSSWHLVSGPAAAISIVVFGVVSGVTSPESPDFIPLTLTLTFLVGLFQLCLGLLRFGALVNFISHTVIIGFTAGAAILIATSQLKHVLGINVESASSFYATLVQIGSNLNNTNLYALGIGFFSLLTAYLFKRWFPRLPNMLMAMAAGTLLCFVLSGQSHGVALLGAIPGHLPPLSFFDIQFDAVGKLGTGALAVAIIALIEAVSIGRAIALKSGQRVDGNQEFIGQGLSNTIGSFFSCFAGSGSFTRSGVNYDAGARTPLAAVFAAILLAIIMVAIPEITAWLPMPVMGGIVTLIAWNLIDLKHIAQIVRVSREEAGILFATFSATLIFPLEFAIYAGVILSIALFLRHSARPKLVTVVPIPYRAGTPLRSAERHQLQECDKVKILRLDGELFFGSVSHIQNEIQWLAGHQQFDHLLLVGSGINYIDLTGAEMLAEESRRLKEIGICLHLSNFKGTVLSVLENAGLIEDIGRQYIYPSHHVALRNILSQLQCHCPKSLQDGTSLCVIHRSYGHRGENNMTDLVYTPRRTSATRPQ